MTRERDYSPVLARLQALASPHLSIDEIGRVGEWPFMRVHIGEQGHPSTASSPPNKARLSKPRLLLTAGVHGDEPAGVEAVLRFLERDHTQLVQRFDLHVLPCVNPTGYVRNRREKVAKVGPIDPHDGEDDEQPLSPGLYPVATSWGTMGMAPYFLSLHGAAVDPNLGQTAEGGNSAPGPRAIISETPTDWSLDQRAAAHLTVLDALLHLYDEGYAPGG